MAAESTAAPAAPRFEESQRFLLVLRLVTEVTDDGLSVRLSPLPGTGRQIPFAEIETVEVATYDPGEHGGWHWGLRVSPGGNAAYRAAGDRGVRLRLTDGSTVFVGSRRPEALRAAVAARVPGA